MRGQVEGRGERHSVAAQRERGGDEAAEEVTKPQRGVVQQPQRRGEGKRHGVSRIGEV